MRTSPTSSPPALTKRVDPELITQTRQYKLITPLFGGGTSPAAADPVTVIRPTEIRGHLRFWWRACRAGKFNGSLQEMKKAEDKLWGAPSTSNRPRPSKVQISLDVNQRGRDVLASALRTQLGYGTFPLQDKPNSMLREDVQFTLRITFPKDSQEDVVAALWSWETFGGLGARTRRGFGALFCTQIDGNPVAPPQASGMNQVLLAGLAKHVVDGRWPADVPHLSQRPAFWVKPEATPAAAWQILLKKLKDFRQDRPFNRETNRPGRSRWPEPEAIRRLTHQRLPRHQELPPRIDKFPRAAFGLPIIFHFKDQNRQNATSQYHDPADTTLQGKNHDRLASPLILRPLACANDQAVSLALVLEAPRTPPGGVILKDVSKDHTVNPALSADEARQINVLRGQPDVLLAFLNYLKETSR